MTERALPWRDTAAAQGLSRGSGRRGSRRFPMPYETPPWTQIIAHRGNSGPLPENTLIAINSAIEFGVDMVEIDVRLTRDGVPILMHSDRVDHTTSGTGLVADLTWDELMALDAGSWRGPEFAGQSLCSLQEVLELTVGWAALSLDVEDPSTEPTVIATVRDNASAGAVITGCGEQCIRRVGSLASGISTLLNPDE